MRPRTLIIVGSSHKRDFLQTEWARNLPTGVRTKNDPECMFITPAEAVAGRQFDLIINGVDRRLLGERLPHFDAWIKEAVMCRLSPHGFYLDLGNGEGN